MFLVTTNNSILRLNDIIRDRRTDGVGKGQGYRIALPAGYVELGVVGVLALEENMVVGVCFYGSEVVCTDGPEDDRGLHQRVCRLRSVVCSARSSAVVSHLKDIASKLVSIQGVADVERVTCRISRDDCDGLLAGCILGYRAEYDRGSVECVCNCGKVCVEGVENLECSVAEPPYLTDVGCDVVNADLARNAYGLVVVCVFTRCKACGLVLCGGECRLGPEVDHNALEIELGELLVFVHQSSEVVGVGVRDDPRRDGDILVGLGVVLRLLAECLDDVCGVDAGVSVVSAVNDDEAAVRKAVDDAHTVLLIVAAVNSLNAYHRDLRGGNGFGIALLCGKRMLTEGLDDHADFLIAAEIRGVNGVFIGIEDCKLVSDDLVCRIGLISYCRKLCEVSGVKLGGGILNDNAVASVAHISDG